MRVQQLRWLAVLESHEWRSGTIPDRQDATVRLIRCVEIPMMGVTMMIRVMTMVVMMRVPR
eukprot:8155771-Pyramimonas_sp.AAC.1